MALYSKRKFNPRINPECPLPDPTDDEDADSDPDADLRASS